MVADRWLVISVHAVADEDVSAELVETLLAFGGAAVAHEGSRLVTYIRPPDDAESFVRRAKERLERILAGDQLDLSWEWRPDADWSEQWRRGLRPRHVGQRLVVTPSWHAGELGADAVVVVIDPEMAFGTGEHASTRGVLRLLERAIEPEDRVLDAGTGSGILAIAAAKLGASTVLAVDNDDDAIRNARANVERNGVGSAVQLVHAAVTESFLAELKPRRFRLVAANILSSVLVPLLPAFRSVLDESGVRSRPPSLILGGILREEAAGVLEAARAAGFALCEKDVEDEWWAAWLGLRTAQ